MLNIQFPASATEKILSGKKTQAIIDENPFISAGDTVRFTPPDSLSQKGEKPACGVCTSVLPILILPLSCEIFIDSEILPREKWAEFAHKEGYSAISELFFYFLRYDVFKGQLITWELTKQLPEVA